MQEKLVKGRAFDFDAGVLDKNFFPQTSGDIIFFPEIQLDDIRYFSRIISHERCFSSVQKFFFRRVFPYNNYFLEISLRIFFPEVTHTLPLKRQMVGH